MDRRKELSRKLIFEALVKARSLFAQKPTEEDLETYADLLVESFEFKQVTWAISQVVKSGKTFFPSCGEIFGVLTPKQESSDDRAALIVEEIFRAVQWFGYMRVNEAFEKLSNEAKATVMSPAFLREICDTPSDYSTTLRAQVRQRAKAALENNKATKQNIDLMKIGIDVPKEGKLLDFTGFLPGA